MSSYREQIKEKRKFHPIDLKIDDWPDLEPYFSNLTEANLSDSESLQKWLLTKSELEAILEEEMAWRYIHMNCDTENEGYASHFNSFVEKIQPHLMKLSNELDKKFIEAPSFKDINQEKYLTLIRSVKKKIELFREENIPVFTELNLKEQEFGKISAKMTITFEGKEYTLQQASKFLKEIDRETREKIYFLISERRIQDAKQLDLLFFELIELRNKIALTAGFKNYRDFKHESMGRFDYQVKDCLAFHDAIQTEVCPIVEQLYDARKRSLNVESLKPWDLEVDPQLKPPIKSFENDSELIDKSIEVFTRIRPKFGSYLQTMKDNGYLDLNSRKGKAPGGFNYPLYESNIPFIFMNAAGNFRDLITMMHEGGHAIHSFLSKDLDLVDFKSLPSEVAELASMSMELISMEHWNVFFPNKEDLQRARKKQLEDVLKVLPWIAIIDKFQHWIYENPKHQPEDRKKSWMEISDSFGSKLIDKKGLEKFYEYSWQKQLHLFEVPFYYIEYGIAQLGAIAIWRNYKNDPETALNQYEKSLSLGYSMPIPEIYASAGIQFNFSQSYIKELMNFVRSELAFLE